jgi:DNA-binding transcriptional LysR family regulator
MDLKHVRTFVTVAEQGSVSKAALRLHITQPALSRQIQDFQRGLGLKLFDRVGRGLVLTSEGEQLLIECRALLTHAETISERAKTLQHGDTGTLNVAASPVQIEAVLSGFLHRYAERYPKVDVRVIEAVGPDILPCLSVATFTSAFCCMRLRSKIVHSGGTRCPRLSFWPFAILRSR